MNLLPLRSRALLQKGINFFRTTDIDINDTRKKLKICLIQIINQRPANENVKNAQKKLI